LSLAFVVLDVLEDLIADGAVTEAEAKRGDEAALGFAGRGFEGRMNVAAVALQYSLEGFSTLLRVRGVSV
jgi:hypothetical protein